MVNPLINILIRTSERPVYFTRCLQSIQQQTYKNVRIIVSYDTQEKPDYIPCDWQIKTAIPNPKNLSSEYVCAVVGNKPIETIPVTKHTTPFGYNLYCNDLIAQVNEGYWLILDDDAILLNNMVLAQFIPRLKENKANIVRFMRGRVQKPSLNRIEIGKIGMPCIVLHAKHKGIATFDDSEIADYRFIKECVGKLGTNFIPLCVVRDDKRNRGRMEE